MSCIHGYLLLLALSGLSYVLGEVELDWKPPKFCNRLDCPRYTVLNTTKDYEARAYEESKWVTTMEQGMDYRKATNTMFRRLFAYISGGNEPGKKIAMTAPVLIKIASSDSTNNYTMGFYVAPKDSTSPPAPKDPKVNIGTLPAQTVYTRAFGGFAGIGDYKKEAGELMKALPAGAKVDKSYYYGAGYDSPFRLFNRHNEVWFIVM